jgi:hypothetical protein
MTVRWAIMWRSTSELNGDFMWNGSTPYLFRTKREAKALIDEKWGYIKDRPDLRAEPHGWRLPVPVKVEVIIREVTR